MVHSGSLSRLAKNIARKESTTIADDELTPAQTRKLKQFFCEFFDEQPAGSEGKALGIETAEAFGKVKAELSAIEGQSSRYPFLSALGRLQDLLREVTGKPYAWYLQELGRHEDHLLDLKESILDPIRRFMGGGQKAIYDEARSYLADQTANFGYGGDETARAIREVLDDPNCFKGNAIQQIKGTLDALRVDLDKRIAAERTTAIADVDELRAKLRALPEFASLAEPDRREIEAAFTTVLETIQTSNLIAVIRERASGFRASSYPALLGRVTAPTSVKQDGGDNKLRGFKDSASGLPLAPPQPEYVAASVLRITYAKPYLADERDIDAYLDTLREMLIAEIRAGKRVTV